jgi:mannose-6-phosphate isomerase
MDSSNILDKYKIESFDLKRPWGGFYCIDKDDLINFINDNFKMVIDTNLPLSNNILSSVTPKILIVNPRGKLSWQYHVRRKEIWSVLKGPVQLIRSFDNEQSNVSILNTGDVIILEKEERHRLVGLDEYAMVAELWLHTDINHLSDEEDIVRVQDDYNR